MSCKCACQVASIVSESLRHYGLQPTRLLCPCDSPKQKYWSGLPLPSLGGLPDPGIKPTSLMSSVGRWVLYHWCHLGSPINELLHVKCSEQCQHMEHSQYLLPYFYQYYYSMCLSQLTVSQLALCTSLVAHMTKKQNQCIENQNI